MASKLKKLRRRIFARLECVPIALGFLIVPCLPRGGVLWLARVMGRVACACDRRGRSYAVANIALVFPKLSERRKRLILLGCYRNIARVLLDMFWFGRDSAARVKRWTSLTPVWKHYLDLPGAKVIVTAHHGNWEMAGHVVVSNGYPLMSVGKPLGTPATTRKLNAFRRRLGQEIVLAEGAVLPLLRTLKKGKNIAVLADQHLGPSEGGVWADFLGIPAMTAPTPAFFAQRVKGAIVGVAYLQARPDGSYRCAPPIIVPLVEGETMEALTQRITDASSRLIRRFPTQWLFAYKRWCDIPPGTTPSAFPFYARPARPAHS
ncbi:MAG: lysophospholipid acyltransferase family protein [Kiritimatiellaeota bacterium]|nr:lysophospholipid acyltransferase family protein [Kiritimatiellota bacterium]